MFCLLGRRSLRALRSQKGNHCSVALSRCNEKRGGSSDIGLVHGDVLGPEEQAHHRSVAFCRRDEERGDSFCVG